MLWVAGSFLEVTPSISVAGTESSGGKIVCPERKKGHCHSKKSEIMLDRLREPIFTLPHNMNLFIENNKRGNSLAVQWLGLYALTA